MDQISKAGIRMTCRTVNPLPELVHHSATTCRPERAPL